MNLIERLRQYPMADLGGVILCKEAADELERKDQRIEQLEGGLRLIESTGCERIWTKDNSFQCASKGNWSKDAEYSDERWCDPCIAHEALSEDN